MIEQFRLFIEKNPKFKKGIVLALSGGVDSMTLLHLLQQTFQGPLTIVHVNHMLREDAQEDEEFVRNIAQEFRMPYYVKKVNVAALAKEQGENIENMGRMVRYTFLEEVRKKTDSAVILTAHHGDDQIESMLMHLVRGTSLRGLMGLSGEKRHIVRPLLPFSKEEILDYARHYQLLWREDRSNEDTGFIRNRLRKEVLPVLATINPQVGQAFLRMSEDMRLAQECIVSTLRKELGISGPWIGPFSFLHVQGLSPFLRRSFIAVLIEEWGDEFIITSAHISNREKQLSTLTSGKRVYLTPRVYLKRDFDVLSLCYEERGEKEILQEKQFSFPPDEFVYGERSYRRVKMGRISFEKELTLSGMILRPPRPKDRLRFSHGGKVFHKSLKKYAVERSIPLLERPYLPCIVSAASGEVLGILGEPSFVKGDPELFIFYEEIHAVS